MALINKNCYHALALKEEEYAYCSPIEDFTLCGGQEFTLSIQFQPRDTSQEILLFRQPDVVTIGWVKGAFYYATKAAGKVSAEQWSMPVAENEWNQFDLTCKEDTLTFYINGLLGYQVKIKTDSQIGKQNYQIGSTLDGYIRYARIANLCLEQKDILSNQYQNRLETSQLELFFDFSKPKAKDLGRHSLPILLSGLSEVKDIVRTLNLEQSGIAVPMNSEAVNPGGFPSGQYTLYHRVFLHPGKDCDTVVAGNGNLTKGIVLTVTSDFHMKLVWNGQEYPSKGSLPTYQWLDLAATYDGTALRLYINGDLDTEAAVTTAPAALSEGNMQIGNVLVNGRTLSGQSFRGYIDCVAVFDTALTQEQLKKYTEQAPYIYEEHLQALYQFQDKQPHEAVTSSMITLSSGAVLTFAENTLRTEEIGEVQYNLGETKGQYTDFETWEANTVAMAITSFFEEQTALKPTLDIVGGETLKGGSLDFMVKNVLTEPEAKLLLCSASAITAAEVLSLLQTLEKAGKLTSLFKTLYSVAPAFLLDTVSSMVATELLSDVAVFLAGMALLCTVVATVVNQKEKEPPTPTPPVDPGKIKYRFLQVKSIQFQHSEQPSESSIPLAKSSKEAVATPEWMAAANSNPEKPSLAAYIRDQIQSVKIIVTFYYETNYTDSVVLNVAAEECGGTVLGSIANFDLSVTKSGDYTKTLTLTKQALKGLETGKYSSRYNWSCKQLGFLGSSYHATYLLPTTPISPWSTVKGKLSSAVTVGALEFLCRIVQKNGSGGKNASENAIEVAAKTVHHLLDEEKYQYPEDAMPQYTDFNEAEDTVIFDQDRFDADSSGDEKLTVNCLDCSAIIVNNCALTGKQLNIMDMLSYEDKITVEMDGERLEVNPFLAFEKTILIGEKDWNTLEDIDTHYLAAEGENKNLSAVVYDGCLIGHGSGDKKIYAAGIPFTQIDSEAAGARDESCYRETWIQEGNSCNIDRKYGLQHGEVTYEDTEEASPDVSRPLTSIMYFQNQLYVNTNGRFHFDSLTIRALPVTAGENRCHSVSYSSLCDGIASPINAYLRSNLNAAQVKNYLEELRRVVFINHTGTGADAAFYNGAIASVQQIHTLLSQNSPANFQANGSLQTDLANLANRLLAQMNNSLNNLRIGSASWNQSIQEGFDPKEWYYVNASLQISGDWTTLAYSQPPARPAGLPAFPEQGFYLPNTDDGNRIYGITHNTYGNAGFCIYTARQQHTTNGFVFSSSNRFAQPATAPLAEPVYYLKSGAWVKL